MSITLPKIVTTDMLQCRIGRTYRDVFGRTPLQQRLDDILGEATKLYRYTDLANMREEVGDTLSSLLQLCNESGWRADDLINENLKKIRRRKKQYQGLGRKTKLAILGGAFDPIHNGHIALAEFVLKIGTFDEVWVVPCAAHMYGKKMAPYEHRHAMCMLATQGHGRIKVSDYEHRNKLKGETYHMVKRFLEDYKNLVDPSIVIGLDNANTFDKWVNYRDLERMVQFVVVPRAGEVRDPKVTWYTKPPHVYVNVEPGVIPELSSTTVRKNLETMYCKNSNGVASYQDLQKQLHPAVLTYINTHDLYGNQGNKKNRSST